MKTASLLRILLAAVLASAGLVAFSGCTSSAQDSAVPWSRPASWEGTMPGVGGP